MARTLPALATFSVGLFCLLGAGCKSTAADLEEAALLEERADIFAAPPSGQVHDLQRRSAELAAMSEDEVRAAQRENRLSRERVRLLAAAGPPIELVGRIVSAETRAPEIDCHISYTGQEVFSDENGVFTLHAIPSDGQVRVRIKCRGLVERHNFVIPAVEDRFELPDVIELGRGLNPAHPSGLAPPDDARQDFDGAVSVLDSVPHGPNVKAANTLPTDAQRAQLEAGVDAEADTTPRPKATEEPEIQPTVATPPAISIEPEQVVTGSLSSADIAPELRRRAHALHSCYAEFLEANRDARGAVRVRWVIGATGIPEAIEVRQSTFDMPERDECIKRRIARLSFPASDSTTTVNQTFVFSFWLNPQDQIK